MGEVPCMGSGGALHGAGGEAGGAACKGEALSDSWCERCENANPFEQQL